VNDVNSDLCSVQCGVPQGSVLGPILFLIRINDLTSLPFKGLLTLFADDTSLFYFGNEHENRAQLCEDLKLLESWCNWTKLANWLTGLTGLTD